MVGNGANPDLGLGETPNYVWQYTTMPCGGVVPASQAVVGQPHWLAWLTQSCLLYRSWSEEGWDWTVPARTARGTPKPGVAVPKDRCCSNGSGLRVYPVIMVYYVRWRPQRDLAA